MKTEHNFIILTDPSKTTKEVLEDGLFLFNEEDEVKFVDKSVDIFDILVDCGIFKSKSDARKNWKLTEREIPFGWMRLQGVGKMNHEICIWKPDWNLDSDQRLISATRLIPAGKERILENVEMVTMEQLNSTVGQMEGSALLIGKRPMLLKSVDK